MPNSTKQYKSGFNENLKMKFFSTSIQPGITWFPIEENRHFECLKCGNKATVYSDKKHYCCDRCWVLIK